MIHNSGNEITTNVQENESLLQETNLITPEMIQEEEKYADESQKDYERRLWEMVNLSYRTCT